MNFPHVLKRGSVVVKVYRVRRPARLGRPAQTVFTLSWYTGGKRNTLQFADVDAAVEEGRLKLDQLAAGKIDAAAEMTINDADALAEARRIAGSVPLIAALEEWHRARELAGGKLIQAAEAWAAKQGTAYEPETVSVIIDRFLKGKKGAGVKTKKVYKVLFDLHWALTRADPPVDPTAVIDSFRHYLQQEGSVAGRAEFVALLNSHLADRGFCTDMDSLLRGGETYDPQQAGACVQARLLPLLPE